MLTTECAASMVMAAYIVLMASLKHQANCVLDLKFVTEQQWNEPHQKQTRSCFSIWSCKTVCVTHGATLLVGCRSWVFSLGWNMSRELSPLSPSPTLRLSPPPCCLAFLPVSPAPRLPGSQAPCHLVLLVGSEARSWDQHCLPSSYVGSEARSWDQHCLPSSYVGSEARSWDQHCLPSSYTLAISGCREWMKWSSLLQQLPALFI